ncbi:hypothetical protein D3C71_1463100 [compost metagenome]
MKILLGGEKPFVELGDAFFQLALSAHEASGLGDPGLCEAGIKVLQRTFDEAGHLRRDDRIDTSHVRTHRLQLAQRAQYVLAVATDRSIAFVTTVDGVPDQHLLLALPVTVDSTVALLHHVGVVRDLQVDEAVAVVLQVDTLGGRIGGQQDANGRILSRGLERGFDGLPLILSKSTVEQTEAFTAEAMAGEDLVHPLVCGAVFGEQDHPAIVPLAARLQIS